MLPTDAVMERGILREQKARLHVARYVAEEVTFPYSFEFLILYMAQPTFRYTWSCRTA